MSSNPKRTQPGGSTPQAALRFMSSTEGCAGVAVQKSQRNEPGFVGRSLELAAIRSGVDAASKGQAQVFWIEGEAGSGKTALIRRAIDELSAGFTVLRAEADELAADASMAVLNQLGPISDLEPFAAGMELLQFFGTSQDSGPLAVVIEDLHWADVASRQALLTTARRLGDDRVLMLVTSRPSAFAADGWERFCFDPDRCHWMALGALTSEETEEMARLSGVSMTRRDAERLHRHTSGHPLYIRTLLGELTPEQLTAPQGELPAPRSLASATIGKLTELPSDSLALAAALAVVNQRVPLATAARIAGITQPTRALEDLLATGFVTWAPAEPQTPVHYAHPLYRRAVYDDLSPTRRQSLHRSAAESLDAGAALAHRVAAADGVDDDLAGELRKAALAEIDKGARALAAAYLLWASSLSSVRDQRDCLLLEGARLLLADGQTSRVAGLRTQLEDCRESPLRALALGALAWDLGDAESAEQWLSRVAEFEGEGGLDPEFEAAAVAQLSIIYSHFYRGQEAVAAATRALSLGPSDPDVEHDAWTAMAIGEAIKENCPSAIRLLNQRLPSSAEEVPAEDADLLIVRGALGFYAGDTTAALADLRTAVILARQGFATKQLPRAHLHLAQLLFDSGDWDEALMHARLSLSLTSDEKLMWIEGQAHAVLGSLFASRGEWDAAAEHVQAAQDAAADWGTFESAATALMCQAALARARNQPEVVADALRMLTRDGEIHQVTVNTMFEWWPALVVAMLETGDLTTAARHIEQLEAAAEQRGFEMRARILGLKARLNLALGHDEEASREFYQAISLLGVDDPLLDRALLHQAFGQFLQSSGDRRGSLLQLRLADDLLAAVGAEPFRQRVRADMEAYGIGADAHETRVPLALTERESEVVALVAKGMTNREAAGELYVSQKAVEYHLSNVFDKLGIRSRRQLRDLAAFTQSDSVARMAG
jgi:DNA-binding CsgD family transcriptional regulator